MNTRKQLLIGSSDFMEMRESNAYYIDKTMFIHEIIMSDSKVLLIPRPRRFGKTLNLSMLRYFFEKSEKDNSSLFNQLAIQKHKIFTEHQGCYPVIYLTFKNLKAQNWENLYNGLCRVISMEIKKHGYLLNWENLHLSDKNYLESIINNKASQRDYEDSLLILSELLSQYHKKQIVILIDEYDTPIHSGYSKSYYEDVVSFMRNFLSGGLKDNKFLFKGVITGILRVARESVFSDLNNLGVYTLLEQDFNKFFGFTEDEVKQLLKDYSLSDKYEIVSNWYNGYIFGLMLIYNPWSVLNYIASKDKKPRLYWINTGGIEIIEELLTRGGRELRRELGELLEGKYIIKSVYDCIVMKDLEKRGSDLLWTFMVFSGYLKPVKLVNEEDDEYKLQIPNQEVRMIYRRLIKRWFQDKIDLTQLEDMLNDLTNGNISSFENNLKIVVTEIMSYHDLSGNPEKVYHALVLGMLVWLSGQYEIKSNRESGYGRYDMLFKPKDLNKQGIIIEFKKIYDKEKPETVLNNALKQIEDKKYGSELKAAGVVDVLKLAIAFKGKKLWLKQSS